MAVKFNKLPGPGMSKATMKFAVTLEQQRRVDAGVKEQARIAAEKAEEERLRQEAEEYADRPNVRRRAALAEIQDDLERMHLYPMSSEEAKLNALLKQVTDILMEMNEDD